MSQDIDQSVLGAQVSSLKVGDRLSETQYYTVTGVGGGAIGVRNDRGLDIRISPDIVEDGMFSAGQFSRTEKVSRTELVEVLEGAGNTIFTVCFRKQPKPRDIAREIADGITGENGAGLRKLLEKAVLMALAGETRILIGHLVSTEPKMGRSRVVDLEASTEHRLRLVDHRSLEWLILKGVRYLTK